MAASIDGMLPTTLQEKIQSSKLLVVGAGGIGCEILKNLVLSGFSDIEIIDLDTIDLSNLNRQFLFHREHVGKSKAQVARESALAFNPDVKIKAYHDSIFSTDYGVNFFKRFDIVLNALDNNAARNHVNRMCLNADVPLIESGTAGYNGQVELIKKGLTQCYECTPKEKQRTFPGCTIRNTPSEPIHCVVWAKHLFNQLFGETIEDQDISPDFADPEAKEDGESGNAAETGNVARVNTRQWACDTGYDVEKLFNKFFFDDIKYLLSMSNLWKTRKAPTPIRWDSVLLERSEETNDSIHQYHKVWSLAECGAVFEKCLKRISESFKSLDKDSSLVWDKDDQPAMDFVAASANIRAYIFNIGRKSRFEVKSMAGNIIPAIATTNAITAGLVVLQAFKVLQGQFEKCKVVYTRLRLNPRQRLIVPDAVMPKPNPNCYVCAAEPAIVLRIDTKRMRIKDFRDEVLVKTLNMVNPDVILDSKGVVLISSEEGETECNEGKLLSDMNIVDGVILKCDDFFQNYELRIIVTHIETERDDALFEVVADSAEQLKPKEDAKPADSNASNGTNHIMEEEDIGDGPSTSKRCRKSAADEDDDLCIIEDESDNDDSAAVTSATNNLKVTSPPATKIVSGAGTKRKPPSIESNGDNDVTEILDSDDEAGPSHCKRTRTAV